MGLVNSNGSKFFGVVVQPEGGNLVAKVRYNAGSGTVDGPVLISSGNFELDKWYGVMLTVDNNDGFVAKIWQIDNGDVYGEATITGFSSDTWKFRERINTGTLWLDSYFEGVVYSIDSTTYQTDVQYDTISNNGIPDLSVNPTLMAFKDLKITWSRAVQTYSKKFDRGDAAWQGTSEIYRYETSDQDGQQYGNITRTEDLHWNGTSWQKDRATWSKYYPNTQNGKYLVGLPGFKNVYDCSNGTCDYEESNVVSSVWYVYDSNATYNQAPSNGYLTATRQLVCFANNLDQCYEGYDDEAPRELFIDERFTYDNWGNQNDHLTYTGYGYMDPHTGSIAEAYQGLAENKLCYGVLDRSSQQCSDDGYRTYLQGEIDAAGHITTYTVDKNNGQTISMVDPNGVISYATYDSFGRLLTIKRPGDSTGSETVKVTYTNYTASPLQPFWVKIEQKISGTTYNVTRRFYDGFGELIQEQTGGAQVTNGSKDLVVDTEYDTNGQMIKQTVPYELGLAGSNPYRGQLLTQPHTTWTYDVIGRKVSVQASDGNATHYSYSIKSTTTTDALNHSTTTLMDNWGRTVQVIPASGPGTTYTYNDLDQLLTATYGSAVTSIKYDYAGRKVSMDDPDMGSWSYAYDPRGNLLRQTDAKGQTTCSYYDSINRNTGKYYTTGTSCPGSPTLNISYFYDGGTYGKGHRTSMSDLSGGTSWTYDTRGRMVSETKTVTDYGTYKTLWSYNSADLVTSMTYPGDNNGGAGETVAFTYTPQLTTNTATGTNPYVVETQYDDSGRVDLRKLGGTVSTPTLLQDYVYYGWTETVGSPAVGQGGRLKQLKAGTSSDTTSLMNFSYVYDKVGNVSTIADTTMGSTQTQTFTYDTLNRLASGQASGGNYGSYSNESYGYDGTTGNLISKAGTTLSYSATTESCAAGDRAIPHAASAAGDTSYTYDCNGNMVSRTTGDTTLNLTYDSDNHLTGAGGAASASYVYDGDGNMVKSVDNTGTTIHVGNYFEAFIPTVTPTPTDTPVPTQVDTPIPTQADTPVPTETTPVPTTFPTNPVLDDFNRSNGSVGNNWSGNTGDFAIYSQKLRMTSSSDGWGYLIWKNDYYEPNQEAYLTIGQINSSSNSIDVFLKAQSNVEGTIAMIDVWFDPSSDTAQVAAYELDSGWYIPDSPVSVTLQAGDQIGGVATADGQVEVYHNGQLVTTVDMSGWTYYAEGGFIGVAASYGDRIDDFGGGTTTPMGYPTFPETGVLDDFNRSNGAIGSNWARQTSEFSISSQHLIESTTNDWAYILWTTSYGADQEVYFTLNDIDQTGDDIEVMLKGQWIDAGDIPMIDIWLEPDAGLISVAAYDETIDDWILAGQMVAVNFADGDRIGAVATADGQVRVYQNDQLILMADVSAWQYYNQGGYIGLAMTDGNIVDDFGGGSISGEMNTMSSSASSFGQQVLDWLGSLFSGSKTSEPPAGANDDFLFARKEVTEAQPLTDMWSSRIPALQDHNQSEVVGSNDLVFDTGAHLGLGVSPAASVSEMIQQVWRWIAGLFGDGNADVTASQQQAVAQPAAQAAVPAGQIYRNYVYSGGQRVALREYTASTNTVYYLLGDHLGSTSVVANADGTPHSKQLYKPWGETRYTSGTLPTDYQFTGQRNEDSIGLYYYGARWYDPALGRFIQADTIVPGIRNPLELDRYAYVNENPLRYNDPTGHCPLCLTAVIGGAVGAIVGAVGYTAYTVATGTEFNTGHMLLAAGGGAVAGALIGTGIGWAAGVSAAEATAAGVTAAGVVEAANTVCQGDMCAGEAQDVEQAATNASQVVYRGLATGEDPSNGLFARAINSGNSAVSHVAGKIQSQWISTSRDLGLTLEKWGKNGVVEINLAKVNSQIVDFSNGIPGSKGTMLSNWALKYQEVLIKNYIPPEAIVRTIFQAR